VSTAQVTHGQSQCMHNKQSNRQTMVVATCMMVAAT
jgi:hypothetical protein